MSDIAIAITSALAGFLVWMAQKYYEHQAAERLRKEELYRSLLTASIELFATGDGAPFVIESQQAWLYASDEVLENINSYLKEFSDYSKKMQNKDKDKDDEPDPLATVKKAEGCLRLSIRKDLKPDTKITPQWITDKWETIISRPERIRRYLGRESVSPPEDKTV